MRIIYANVKLRICKYAFEDNQNSVGCQTENGCSMVISAQEGEARRSLLAAGYHNVMEDKHSTSVF